MPRRLKVPKPCEQCGQLTDKGHRPNKPRLCLDCGLTNAANAARQPFTRSGPAWDAWLASRGPNGRPRSTQTGSE